MVQRLVRDTALACATMALGLYVWQPDRPRLAAGVLGGGALIGLALWAIMGVVDQVARRGESGEIRAVSGAFQLVKFFTRYGILALAAYGMMLRLRLDPVGMLVGVSSVVVAVAAEAARWRRR